MKTLAKEFNKATDGLKTHRFVQLKRVGGACLYGRYDPEEPDGSALGYEVFTVNVQRSGKKYSQAGDETYPRANAFGKTAWFCTTLERANARFYDLTASSSQNTPSSLTQDAF